MIKLVSWNVGGLRACMKRGFISGVRELNPDVVCLQETKMEKGQAEVDLRGYEEYWNSAEKKGYSGTAVFSRGGHIGVSYGIGVPGFDNEGRVITLEFERFYLVNVYSPNSRAELIRLPYRMDFEDLLREYLLDLDARKPVVVCGDLNVAHREIDIRNPKSNQQTAGFTREERGKLSELLLCGFTDTFRHLHPDLEGAYTWWSFRSGARERNVGWRLDYFLVSDRLRENIAGASIYPEITGSDHCPVGLWLEL